MQRFDLDVVALLDFDVVVEDQVEQYDDQNDAEAYLEDAVVDVRRHERANDIADDYRYRQHKAVPQVKHSLAEECNRRCEVLQEYGDTVCSVGDGNWQTECCKHRDGHNRAATGQCVDRANDNTRRDEYQNYMPIQSNHLSQILETQK